MKENLKNEILAEFDDKFGNMGTYRSDELSLLNFDAGKLLGIKSFLSQAIDRAYEAGWEDGYNDNENDSIQR